MKKSPSIAIIGSGFGGLAAAYHLKKAGFERLTIFEKEGELGGVWRDNTYPGAACDVPSHLYSFSFEPGFPWTRRYGRQAEILAYLRHTAQKHDLVRHVRFGEEVVSAAFDAACGAWTLRLASGATHEAKILISAVGQLHRPAYPAIEGRGDFGGVAFHSARWDHTYPLQGRTVAVIGTGASAVQFVPEIAKEVKRLYVFQRSPGWIGPKLDRAFGTRPRRVEPLRTALERADRLRLFLWFDSLSSALHSTTPVSGVARRAATALLRVQVSDPALRAKLTPDYPLGCKRVLLSNDWLPALARPNVEVVTDPIERLVPTGVRTRDGRLREVDAVIYGTGFAATEFLAPMEVRGLDGASLRERWKNGASAYLGMTISGFPNFFVFYGPNTNLGAGSIIYMLERQSRYATHCVSAIHRRDLAYLDLRQGAEQAFHDEMVRRSKGTVFERGCHSWYTTADGRNTNNWIGSMLEYGLRTRRPDLSHYRLVRSNETTHGGRGAIEPTFRRRDVHVGRLSFGSA